MITLSPTQHKPLRQAAVRLFADCLPRTKTDLDHQAGPTTEFIPEPAGTRITFRHAGRVLSMLIPDQYVRESLACGSSWLKATQKANSNLTIDCGQDQTVFGWFEKGIPQRWTCSRQALREPLPTVADLQPIESRLLTALASASTVTDQEASRYALANVQLDGKTGSVTGTDGRQLIYYDGFRFPWSDKSVLVKANKLFDLPHWTQVRKVTVGLLDDCLVIDADHWQVRLPVETGRFPNVRNVLPSHDTPANRIYLDAEDRLFLKNHIKQLPGAKVENSPVMLDLNGHVDLWAAGDEHTPSMRIRLSRSLQLGEPRRCTVNRQFLAQATRLAVEQVFIAPRENKPLVFRGDRLTYLAQPLSGELQMDNQVPPLLVDSAS